MSRKWSLNMAPIEFRRLHFFAPRDTRVARSSPIFQISGPQPRSVPRQRQGQHGQC